VLIRVEAAGICGTDQHIFSGKYAATYPLIPGHEYAGPVAELGPGVTELQAGDLISADPNITCGQCPYCRRGKNHLCLNLQAVGVTRAGGFAEFSVVPVTHAYRLPAGMTAEEGALIEPLACALRGRQRGGVQPGDTVLILGGGTMGGLLMQLARGSGAAQVLVAEPIEGRRQTLDRLGADVTFDPREQDPLEAVRAVDEEGADVVCEAAGRPDTAELAVSLAKKGGTVVFFGCVEPEYDIRINPALINDRELTICGSFNNPFTHGAAVALVASGRVQVAAFVSHRFALADFPRAFAYFGAPESYKLVILPHG
jgi:2-desacetyl-2-hydroxyethyl bacteriochlorophyllide A dehydrogenase